MGLLTLPRRPARKEQEMGNETDSRKLLEQTLAGVKQDYERVIRRGKIETGLLCFVVLAVFVYATWLYYKIDQLNPIWLTDAMASYLDGRLPEAEDQLRKIAYDMAPSVTESGKDMLMKLPPAMREMVEENLDKAMDESTIEMEKKLNPSLDDAVDAQLEELEKAHPEEKSEEKRLEYVLEGTRSVFRDRMRKYVDTLYEHYASDMKNLDKYFLKLQNEKNLSPKEQIHREILEVWLTLVNVHKFTKPDETRETPINPPREHDDEK
jgi:hypothetical protein